MGRGKFSLGTANFAKAYGIKNGNGLSSSKINKIFNILKKNKLRNIDTAFSYREVEKKLGYQNLKNFFIYSKIPRVPEKCKNIEEWLDGVIKKSLSDLRLKTFEGIYLHHPEDLLKKNGDILYKNLLNLKESGVVKKIGVSIYSYLTLDKVLNKYRFDVVQLPFNIFDRRLLTNKYFQKIKNKKIEIHTRSIFLQGLLLKDYKKIPKYFKKWKRIFLSWERWCEKKNISKLQSCLNFISSYKKIDKVIIGVADEKQLIQILKCIKKVSKNYPKKIFLNDIKLIDPRKWKKT